MVNEVELRKEFEENKDLQVEFGDDFGAFFALKKHEDSIRKQDERRDRRRANRPRDVEVDEDKLRHTFETTESIRDQFSGIDAFIAYEKALAAGRVRMSGGNVKTFSAAPDVKIKKERVSGIPISAKTRKAMGPASQVFSEALARAEEIRRDSGCTISLNEAMQQYEDGIACDSNGVPLEAEACEV